MSEQRTQEWQLARVGNLTASRFADAVAETKSGWGASRERYKAELICERLTGMPYEHYRSAAMERGSFMEERARAAYSLRMDVDVVEVGFIAHPTIALSGCSPDGLVGEHGLVEIKCPDSHTHIATMLGRTKLPREYLLQMMWQLACTGRQWCDWISFDDRLEHWARFYCVRVERNNKLIEEMEAQAHTFLAEVANDVAELERMYKPQMEAA